MLQFEETPILPFALRGCGAAQAAASHQRTTREERADYWRGGTEKPRQAWSPHRASANWLTSGPLESMKWPGVVYNWCAAKWRHLRWRRSLVPGNFAISKGERFTCRQRSLKIRVCGHVGMWVLPSFYGRYCHVS